MRILFVIKSLESAGGGAERIVTFISSALADRGHDVEILTFDARDAEDFYTVSSNVGRIRMGRGGGRSGLFATMLRTVRLRRAALEIQPDVVVAFMHSAFIPAALAFLGTGVPLIGSERTSFDHYRRRPLERALLHLTAPLLRRLTVNGEAIRRGFPPNLAARMAVIPNPVMTASKISKRPGPIDKTLLSVGGLRPEKDHSTLILAFASIANRFPDWRLRIVGDGPLRDKLSREVRSLGLEARIDLAGATRSVEREYRSAHLFVLPSIYEAFPNCVAEALAHGLPAVGFADCAGTNELIVPGVNGTLAEGDTRAVALAGELAKLMSSPALRDSMARAAPATVAHYRVAKIVEQWEGLLEQVVASKAGSRRRT